MSRGMQSLLTIAMSHGNVEEGIACEGTAMERRTIKIENKAFLFLGAGDALLKLDTRLGEAQAAAAEEPERYRVGKGGWVKILFGETIPPTPTMTAWIAESYALAAAAKAKPKPRRKVGSRR